MKQYWKYLKYVLEHKKNVYIQGRKLGLGVWQLLKHDLSKFSISEFGAYANYFFGNKEKTDKTKSAFDKAWQHHKNHNTHHWQNWFSNEHQASWNMPNDLAKEMVADWMAMTVKFHPDKDTHSETYIWYKSQKDIRLSGSTQKYVEFFFEYKYFTDDIAVLDKYSYVGSSK